MGKKPTQTQIRLIPIPKHDNSSRLRDSKFRMEHEHKQLRDEVAVVRMRAKAFALERARSLAAVAEKKGELARREEAAVAHDHRQELQLHEYHFQFKVCCVRLSTLGLPQQKSVTVTPSGMAKKCHCKRMAYTVSL